MEYKKSDPVHGQLDGRYTVLYQYEFPRATRQKGKYLPQGTVRLREFLFADGGHGQLVQIIKLAPEEIGMGVEQRVMVDKMLAISREDKRFKEGGLRSDELSGEVREYQGRKLIDLGQVLAEQEKIGLFASARRVKDSRIRQRRAFQWKIRIRVGLSVGFFFLGVFCGSLMQKLGLLDLEQNWIYQDYLRPVWSALVGYFR